MAVAIIGAFVVGAVVYSSHRSSASTRPLIVTAAVTRRTLQDQLTLTGTLGRVVQRTITATGSNDRGQATTVVAVYDRSGSVQ